MYFMYATKSRYSVVVTNKVWLKWPISFAYSQANLTELKSFGSPPGAVTNVTAAVMVLLAPNGKIPKDRSWKAAKVKPLPTQLGCKTVEMLCSC